MKKYVYTVNNSVCKGTYYILAKNKKLAIKAAKDIHILGGVNVSSFRLEKSL